MALNIGTKINEHVPDTNIIHRSRSVVVTDERKRSLRDGCTVTPFISSDMMTKGTNRHKNAGTNSCLTMFNALKCPPIHSIMVLTSPMGDHAPPAFAAITIIPAKYQRVFFPPTNFHIRLIITMVVVRLSSNDDMKNVIDAIIQSNFTLSVVLITFDNILKPP
ncbi:MAG: hypothetical protein FWF83_03295 [Clostridiales bacterium]|nr:hypothetical protein [Clostridiales bacterium]